MKLNSVSISNFRALATLDLTDLSDAVVLAGPNGCGKSCILDAIRLLKSAYGSYHQQDEWQTWQGEFQVDQQHGSAGWTPLFQKKDKEITIAATFSLRDPERQYLSENLPALLDAKAWKESNQPAHAIAPSIGQLGIAAKQRIYQTAVETKIPNELNALRQQLGNPTLSAKITIPPAGHVTLQENRLLELIFSLYEPQKVGVIDYHGPHRNYARGRLANVNLTMAASEQVSRQSALYNYNNKYANLKAEMASAYLRHVFAKQSDPRLSGDDSLTETLKELFATFFPGKQFLGVQPTSSGDLLFPVRLTSGAEHDIDELSSGEKEVLYGYLRLHNSAPRNSIIMIDEPELHLNPRLINGLATFYNRHLAQRLGNQLWLVTHSDTLIREAVNNKDFSVYHVQPATSPSGGQATRVQGRKDVERLVIDLIGDLAAYRPGAKIVIFESTDTAAFDLRMTSALFPEFAQQINPISAGDKRRVANLYEVLDKAQAAGALTEKFYAITDADDEENAASPARQLRWDVYHIENYLLQPKFILASLRDVGVPEKSVPDEEAVVSLLRTCARETIPKLIQHKLRVHVNAQLVACIDLKTPPDREDAANAISEAVDRSSARITARIQNDLSPTHLTALEAKWHSRFAAAVNDGGCFAYFRGRDILKLVAAKAVRGMPYEYFRDLILSRMKQAGFKPPGMAKIVDTIVAD